MFERASAPACCFVQSGAPFDCRRSGALSRVGDGNHRAYWVDYAGPGEAPRRSPNAPRDKTPRSLADLDDLAEQAAEDIQRAGGAGSLPEAPASAAEARPSAAEAAGAAAGAEAAPAAAPVLAPTTAPASDGTSP